MLKGTLNSSLWLIRTNNLYFDEDELSVVYCTFIKITTNHNNNDDNDIDDTRRIIRDYTCSMPFMPNEPTKILKLCIQAIVEGKPEDLLLSTMLIDFNAYMHRVI